MGPTPPQHHQTPLSTKQLREEKLQTTHIHSPNPLYKTSQLIPNLPQPQHQPKIQSLSIQKHQTPTQIIPIFSNSQTFNPMARLGLISLLLAGFLLVSTMTAEKSDDLGRDTEHSASTAVDPSSDSKGMEEGAATEAPSFRHLEPAEKGEKARKSEKKADNSVAGGCIIIAGLVTTISAAVFCYIRVTRRRGRVH